MSDEFPFHDARTTEGEQVFMLFKPYITSRKHLESLAQRKELTYIVWQNTLWILRDFESYSHIVRYTNTYSKTTLKACQLLTHSNLASIWAELFMVDRKSGVELTNLILARRDEVLKASLLPQSQLIA